MTVWPTRSVILALHDQHLAEHRGLPGLRDLGSLEQAVAYRELPNEADLAELAAAYTCAIVAAQPFLDANIRTAALACELFLRLNGHGIVAPPIERVQIWTHLEASKLTKHEFAEWLRSRIVELN